MAPHASHSIWPLLQRREARASLSRDGDEKGSSRGDEGGSSRWQCHHNGPGRETPAAGPGVPHPTAARTKICAPRRRFRLLATRGQASRRQQPEADRHGAGTAQRLPSLGSPLLPPSALSHFPPAPPQGPPRLLRSRFCAAVRLGIMLHDARRGN